VETSLVFVVGLLGFFSWKLERNAWKISLWKLVYSIIITFFIAAALFDKFIFEYSTQDRFRFFSIKEFFYGPIPFLVFLLLGKIKFYSQPK
jgi:hypothetical protein